MDIVSVTDRLANAGLEPPPLNALRADDTLYTVLLQQPPGHIRIAANSIGNANAAEANQRTAAFLKLAANAEVQPDLVVSPEYSVPWDTLLDAIEQGCAPKVGKLWILGCESLELGGLDLIRQRLGERAQVLDDDLSPVDRTTQQYRNPLVYVFRTRRSDDQSEQLVLLVQYKTVPSGDPHNTEVTGMLPGVNVYAFGTAPGEVRLITLICSDVFELSQEIINNYYDGLLLLHIQLNNSPRHIQYKKYRPELFAPAGNTELLCLNWAEKIVSVDANGANRYEWNNICGSAWYLRSPETNLSDDALLENHKNGIYYTRHESIRAHAFQFHYKSRVFLVQATKVFHHAIAKPRSTRTGPKALTTYVWAPDAMRWVEPRKETEFADDGFSTYLNKVRDDGVHLDDLQVLYRTGPVMVERAMAITAGQFGITSDWHTPQRIDSMRLCEQEVVRRVTVTQDPAEEAIKFRNERFALIRAIAELRATDFPWPSSVEALRRGFKFNWHADLPNRNVIAADNSFATVVYAGLVADPDALDRLDQKIRKALAGPPREPERLLTDEQKKQLLELHHATAPQRFCILYATAAAGTKTYLSARETSFTRHSGQSPMDIGTPSISGLANHCAGVQE